MDWLYIGDFCKFVNQEQLRQHVLVIIMTDITELFIQLIDQYGSIDIANSEFKKVIAEDANLKAEYATWCHSVGSSEKMGFLDFCEEYLDSQQDIYNNLNDFDE